MPRPHCLMPAGSPGLSARWRDQLSPGTSAQPSVGMTSSLADNAPCYLPGNTDRDGSGRDRGSKNCRSAIESIVKSGSAQPNQKWIGRRSYGGRFVMGRKDILPICIKAGALDDNVPGRDLWISPHHGMYLEGVLIEAKDLVNGISVVQAERVEKVEYFHIELDSHDVMIAEGAPSESFIDDDSRGMFHNAHEYWTLYPGAATELAQYCAPRYEDGNAVETARRRIALRAGLRMRDDELRVGTLRGYVDLVSTERIAGWAQNTNHPEAPVCLDIYAGGRLIGQTLANRYRKDLERSRARQRFITASSSRRRPALPLARRRSADAPSIALPLGPSSGGRSARS